MNVTQANQSDWLFSNASEQQSPTENTNSQTQETEQPQPLPTPEEEKEEVVVEDAVPSVVDNTPKLPESLQEIFENLRVNKNLGFYENTKIETEDDVYDLIKINAEHLVKDSLATINDQWYNSKSDAFKQLFYLSEISGGDMSKVADLLNTRTAIEDFSTFDTSDESQAQVIVEQYLTRKGQDPEIIKDDIADLKERGILTARAEKFKPELIKSLEQEAQAKIQQTQLQEQQFISLVQQNENNVIKFLSEKDLSGLRVSNDDKDLIYSDLTWDNQVGESGGFKIYQKIEEAQSNGDFEKLALVSLILNNKERFDELYSNRIKKDVSKELRNKIAFPNDTSEAARTNTPKKQETANSQQQDSVFTFNPFAR